MKKIIALILSLALSATLFATLASCGKDKKSETTVKYEWNDTYNGKTDCTNENDVVQNLC